MEQNPDREFLLALLRSETIPALTPEQWQTVYHLARQHGVETLLYRQLKKLGLLAQLPAILHQELREAYLRTADRNMRLYRELSMVAKPLNQENIPFILLKGAYLAEHVYGNMAVRPMGDVDILFRKSDLARVETVLLGMNYLHKDQLTETIKETHHFVYKHADHELMLEVHWDLVDDLFEIHTDIQALWERATPISIAGIQMYEMMPEDQILHLCIHTAVHYFQIGLRAMCDLAETLRYHQTKLNWECLRQRAHQWGANRCVYVNLVLVKELLNAPVPADWLESLKPKNIQVDYLDLAREQIFNNVEAGDKALVGSPHVVEFWWNKGLIGKAQLFLRRIFLTRQEMARRYPAPADSWRILLYYPVRLKDLLQTHGQVALRLAQGDAEMQSRASRQNEINTLRNWLLME